MPALMKTRSMRFHTACAAENTLCERSDQEEE